MNKQRVYLERYLNARSQPRVRLVDRHKGLIVGSGFIDATAARKWARDTFGDSLLIEHGMRGHVERPTTSRQRRYMCPHGQIIRAGTDTLQCVCSICEKPFVLS